MAVNPRSNRNADTEHDYAPDARSPAHDMQALLMDLQALGTIPSTSETEYDKIIDKLMMTALYLKSIDRELRIKCLYMAYLFVRPTLNVRLILGEWPEMARLIGRVYPILNKNTKNLWNVNCMTCIDFIVSFMTSYTHDNVGYNPSSSASNHKNSYNTSIHPYKPALLGPHHYSGPHSYSHHGYLPPPTGPYKYNARGTVLTSSIAAQENV